MHVCDNCHGTQFETIDGYFYCQECGTQSQHQLVEMEAAEFNQTFGDTIVLKKNTAEKSNEARITSWEEYNYILVGLVDELITLGANNRFKKTVLKLWTRYLQVNEAAFFSLDDECLPRLPANYYKRDAEILYNKHHRKRRRRNSCTSQDSAETKSSGGKADSVIKSFKISKVLKKTKTELARAQYEDFLKLENDSSSVTTSLASSSQHSTTARSLDLKMTRNARKVMKRRMPKSHLKKHESDHEDGLDCHRGKYTLRQSDKLETLDNRVIVGILYLALNLTGDSIQLSDLIRFLREGHVSSNNIQHFLPENIQRERHTDYESVTRRAIFCNVQMRIIGARLLNDLSIREVVRPDLSALMSRYVDELGLPEEMKTCLDNLMASNPPAMKFGRESKFGSILPNYDARAICYVLFLLKVLFGMDDERESQISQSAREINKLLADQPHLQLFVVEDWLRMLKMRQMVVEKHHLPSAMRHPWREARYGHSGMGNWKMYVDHLKTVHESKIPEGRGLKAAHDRLGVANTTMALLQGMSQKRRKEQEEQEDEEENKRKNRKNFLCDKSYNFPPSMRPFRDYTKILLAESAADLTMSAGAANLLRMDFSLSSMTIFYDDWYAKKKLKEALDEKHQLKLKVQELGLQSRHLRFVPCNRLEPKRWRACLVDVQFVEPEEYEKLDKRKGSYDSEEVDRPATVKKRTSPMKENEVQLMISNMDYWSYYTSFKTSHLPFSAKGLESALQLMPNNFKFLLFECARITEQDPRFLLLELALIERVMIYEKGEARPKGYRTAPPLDLW